MTNNDPSNPAMTKNEVNKDFLLIHILDKIRLGRTPIEIAKKWGWDRQRMRYHIKKLERSGFIRLKTRTSMNIYEITDQGKKFYTGSVGAWSEGLSLHHIEYSYPILKDGNMDKDKVWSANGVGMWFKRMDSKSSVSGNPRSVQIKVQSLVGKDPYQLVDEAKNIADRTSEVLKSRGFELGQGRQSKKPHFEMLDPIAKTLAKSIQLRSDEGEIDESGDGNREVYTPESADAYLKMPMRLAKVEEVVVKFGEEITPALTWMTKNIESHRDVLGGMGETLKGINVAIQELRDAVKELKR